MIAEFLFLSKNKLLLNYLLPFGVPNLVIYIYETLVNAQVSREISTIIAPWTYPSYTDEGIGESGPNLRDTDLSSQK